jgi:hypothetical protein
VSKNLLAGLREEADSISFYAAFYELQRKGMSAAMSDIAANSQSSEAQETAAQNIGAQFTLNLADLLPDANGEIVILNEGDDPCLNIVTDLRLMESGIAESHVTDGGIEVKGLQSWVFEDGTKLYYSPGLSISVEHHLG